MPKLTYISLFSGAGVGCHGFTSEGFSCVLSNELIERRLDVQRFNHKCKYDSGYLIGDISTPEVQNAISAQLELWRVKEHVNDLDILIATPPCQGMSVANHKKSKDEIKRNSLVTESIRQVKQIKPRVFVFENVAAFLKTACTDIDGAERPIGEAIERNLADKYSIFAKIINFKDFGVPSSRTRTLVIGVRKDLSDQISPLELFPQRSPERTLREVIGHLPALNEWGAVSDNDIYHAFRTYPENMRRWIQGLPEGKSAFDNTDLNLKPHRVINGKIVVNQQKNADKYKRQCWNKVGPCIHTRNDQMASQNTLHPSDDRVFSIRELMIMMSIPEKFKWTATAFNELNKLPYKDKRAFLKKEEIKIRQSIGEAVPSEICRRIAANFKSLFVAPRLKKKQTLDLIDSQNLADTKNLLNFIRQNRDGFSVSTLSLIAELANCKRIDNSAYFTNKFLITEIIKELPSFDGQSIRILEPSVGAGNFLPLLKLKYADCAKVEIDVVDIDSAVLDVLRELVAKMDLPANFSINYINDDFLLHTFKGKYDLVVGNPPFSKLVASDKQLKIYRQNAINKESSNLAAFFIEKACQLGRSVALIAPKYVLNAPEYKLTRTLLEKQRLDFILDFGENGFDGVLVETVCLGISPGRKPGRTRVVSITENIRLWQRQNYICCRKYPYWLIYRDDFFDEIAAKMIFDVFDTFRDRQLTNSMLIDDRSQLRVLKSRNISDDGSTIIDIPGYDSYILPSQARKLACHQFLDRTDVYLVPNMTYNPRMMRKPKGTVANGSVAILALKKPDLPLTDEELKYYSSREYRQFYRIARNYQTRSLNIDAASVYFFGRSK